MAQVKQEDHRPSLAVIVAANVYTLRKRRGMTQERLAAEAGITRESVRLLEKSRTQDGLAGIRLSTIAGLAGALLVEPAALLEWDASATRVYLKRKSETLKAIAGGGRGGPAVQSPLLVPVGKS